MKTLLIYIAQLLLMFSPLYSLFLIFLLSGGNSTTPTTIVTDTLPIITPPRDPVPAPVPEPATLALMGVGLAMLARHSKKRKT